MVGGSFRGPPTFHSAAGSGSGISIVMLALAVPFVACRVNRPPPGAHRLIRGPSEPDFAIFDATELRAAERLGVITGQSVNRIEPEDLDCQIIGASDVVQPARRQLGHGPDLARRRGAGNAKSCTISCSTHPPGPHEKRRNSAKTGVRCVASQIGLDSRSIPRFLPLSQRHCRKLEVQVWCIGELDESSSVSSCVAAQRLDEACT